MPETFFYQILFFASLLFGCIIGAYYCTAEYRIRHDQKLATASCRCTECGHLLPLHHQIPVVSWLFLKGKCHFCHKPIPARYPLTEGAFVLYYGLTYLFFSNTPCVFLSLWFLFVSTLMFLQCQRHYRSFIKGFFIMLCYHLVISLVYLVLYDALES